MRTAMLLTMISLPTLLAQQPTNTEPDRAASTARLGKALASMAALPSCAFDGSWGPAKKKDAEKEKEEAAGAFAQVLTIGGGGGPGKVTGAWAGDGLHLTLGDDELRFAGRRMIAKDDASGWQARSSRFADGNKVGFAPDMPSLFAALARMDLDVVHREPGSVGDRPVEILTVALKPEQVKQLVWNDLLPPSITAGFATFVRAGIAVGGAAKRPALDDPKTAGDLAFYVEPGTGLVHRLHLRSYDKNELNAGGRMVFVAAGGAGGVRVGGAGDDDEEEDQDAQKAPKGDTFEDGLPVRSRKKMAVTDFVVDFKDHGQAQLPELDAKAKALLGR